MIWQQPIVIDQILKTLLKCNMYLNLVETKWMFAQTSALWLEGALELSFWIICELEPLIQVVPTTYWRESGGRWFTAATFKAFHYTVWRWIHVECHRIAFFSGWHHPVKGWPARVMTEMIYINIDKRNNF